MSLQSVRGTHDLLPEDCRRHQWISDQFRNAADHYGFREMATPIFEFSQVFERSLGDASDIVTKEMYKFQDKGGDWITLRPEGTAGIARAFVSEGLAHQTPLKLFYRGPMFRYERPQKGRSRQFHQLGVEFLGVQTPLADLECLALAHHALQVVGVRERCELNLNSIGDGPSRQNYIAKLKGYLERYVTDLGEESQKRLNTNPLRILDSKDEKDRRILEGAPQLSDSLTTEARQFLDQVESGLNELNISYRINPHLVRGLDYYNQVVFEFRTQDLGAQDAVLSGGRYDGLIEMMGGPSTAGVGWAAGLERLVLLAHDIPARRRPITLVPMGEKCELAAIKLADQLRAKGLYVELTYSGNLSKRMKKAATLNSQWAIILGETELQSGVFTVKNLDDGSQIQCSRDKLDQLLFGV